MSKPERGVSRRIVLRHGVAAGLGLGLRPPLQAFAASGFDADAVEEAARALAARPYQPPPDTLPETLEKLDYDRYGKIKFRRGKALWRGAGPAFAVEFFHRGYLFKDRIAINEVVDGAVRPIRYDPSWFDLGDVPPPDGDAGLAGFRILTQPSGPHGKDEDMREAAVFLGASYFRAVAPGQNFGLSARGLALGSGEAGAEEFPVFREFWLERPAVSPHADARVLRIYALLDSPSVAGAYRFDLRAGTETVMDIDCMLFPRRDIANAGIAPLTSMFWFDPSRRAGVDDYRQAVHDSDGLLIHNGAGETIWRSLADPDAVQLSAFADTSPRGFGLVQRQRGFTAYEDVGARYDLRPAAWVEPAEEWGAGAVHLAELPTGTEFQDNIVAFWRPEGALRAGTSRRFAYRLRWCDEVVDQARPEASNPLARVVAFRSGASTDPASRFFMLDIAGGDLRPGEAALDAAAPPASPEARAAMLIPEVSCSAGRIKWAEIKPVPAYTVPPARLRSASHPRSEAQLHGRTALYRVGFELTPGDASAVDLTVRVKRGGRTVSETWMYRWTAPKAAPKP